ncbi:MAG: hypothetical protein JW797_14540 [Bradymonadales bacterium]|nr:hypothetical protein [Bradymonadales bacterium]
MGVLASLVTLGLRAGSAGSTVVQEEQGEPLTLGSLTEGQVIRGFRTEAIYIGGRDQVMGARFFHEHTHFTFDYLQIESVPQGFTWINTIPNSHRGEPHILEHLVLGKGNQARTVSALEDMSLVDSSAFTGRLRTCYHFHTVAGPEVFFAFLERQLGALVSPDYDDEEIRREVHHFNVATDPDGNLRLEEGGTVYTEMVGSFERPGYPLWHQLMVVAHGPDHPLSQDSGGLPEAIRQVTPEHIRDFQQSHYRLPNMGLIGSFPSELEPDQVLDRIDEILTRIQPEPTPTDLRLVTPDSLPTPQPGDNPLIQYVDYPHQESQQTVELDFVWPAVLNDLTTDELMLLEQFWVTLAGAANTNLYRRLIDGETREIETGATAIYAWVADWQGHLINLTLEGIPSTGLDEATILAVREIILDELNRIARLAPDDPDLADFNRRLLSNLTASQREIRDFLDSPPRFGYRSIGDRWLTHLDRLRQRGGFRRVLSLQPDAQAIRDLLGRPENAWAELLQRFALLDTEPIALAPRPSPELLTRLQVERESRLEEELSRLKATGGTEDEQEILHRFQEGYDQETARLEEIASQVQIPPFIDDPPLTLDDLIDYQGVQLESSSIPLVRSLFGNMSGAAMGLALRLDAVQAQDLVLLAALPALLRQVGVIEGDSPVSYQEMIERLQNEVLDLTASYSVDYPTGRVELLLQGRGTNIEEARAALHWMELVLYHPDWRPENLPRMRDLLAEILDGLRRTMQASEEVWVNNPADAYRWQENPLILATSSFLTRTHGIRRLLWMLTQTEDAQQLSQIQQILQAIEPMGGELDREGLRALLGVLKGDQGEPPDVAAPLLSSLAGLSESSRALLNDVAMDLELTLGDVPDQTLADDWRYLCRQISSDLAIPPTDLLNRLVELRRQISTTCAARLYAVGAPATLDQLQPDLDRLVGGLQITADCPASSLPRHPVIQERLQQHSPSASPPLFVGLVNTGTQNGVFLNSAPAVSYHDTDPESLLRYLTALTYAGGGNHGVFMNTWAAGLAYSNGIGSDLASGFVRYYAERCPQLPQTLAFVIDLLSSATMDPSLTDYALAQAFNSRSAGLYEVRGQSIASDLVDGRPPELIRAFREALLALRQTPDLAADLHSRLASVYGRVLPGYGPSSNTVEGAVYFVIGPERQLTLYEEYLQSVEGPDSRVTRLYPRDYWLVDSD